MKKNQINLKELISIRLTNPYIKWIIIPFCLLLLWLSLSLTYSSYRSFTVLQFPHYENSSNKFFDQHLFKGNKLAGDFYAKDNNLGIISIRMGDIPQVGYEDQDILLFRIKEKGASTWLHTNSYRSGGINSDDYYPFGFNEIKNSKGKEYVFELVSMSGNTKNSLQTKHSNPIYLSKYKFSKKEIFKNPITLISFMEEKIVTFITNTDLLLSSLIFFTPFLCYFAWLLFPRSSSLWIFQKFRKQINGRRIQFVLIGGFILYDILFYEYLNVGFMLGLLLLWIVVCIIHSEKSNVSFNLAFMTFLISLISIYFHLNISYDKASTFSYFLLIIGFVQSILEINKINSKNHSKLQ